MEHPIDWLVIEATPEQDFKLEREAREILSSEDHERVAEFCASLHRQSWAKDQIIKNCIGKIGDLEGQIIKEEMSRPSLRRFVRKVFRYLFSED